MHPRTDTLGHDLRFGIRVGPYRSRCWRVRSGRRRPELFIEREGLEDAMHLSLHESGRWHIKVRGRGKAVQWPRPGETTPGFTRAVCIVQPNAVAREKSLPDHSNSVILSLPISASPTHFDIMIERPEANLDSWPGMNASQTVFVGRVPLANETGTCCVVARQAEIEPGSLSLPRPDPVQLEEMRSSAARGELYVTMIARQADGALAMIDMHFEVGETGAVEIQST